MKTCSPRRLVSSIVSCLVAAGVVVGCSPESGGNRRENPDPDEEDGDADAAPRADARVGGRGGNGSGGSGGTGSGGEQASGGGSGGSPRDGGADSAVMADAGGNGTTPMGAAGSLEVATGEKVVNVCFVVTRTDGNDVTLADAAGQVTAGATLLLWQVQDSFAKTGDQADITSAATLKDAGVWELARVMAAADGKVTLETKPKVAYASAAGSKAAQACLVPDYKDVKVAAGAKIVAAPWNGKTGGVIALLTAGDVTVDGEITATGKGGRGGPWSMTHFRPDDRGMLGLAAEDTTKAAGGFKGEGLDATSLTKEGRGNYANGAGGGNNTHAGGGGGSNAGKGGFGGEQHGLYGGGQQTRGRGGAAVKIPLLERLVMGGGGGQGQQVTNSYGPNHCRRWSFSAKREEMTAGGAGGGIILIRAGGALKGAGKITADGLMGGCAESDGAGGGGAGGSIWLKAATGGFTGTVSANGGAGGHNLNTNSRVGPGGGGGGGRVRVEVPDIKVEVKGGATGIHYDADDNYVGGKPRMPPANTSPFGASAGAEGEIERG